MSKDGKVGTIIKIIFVPFGGNTRLCHAVVFDEKVYRGHTLGGLCPDGHGWYCFSGNLELVESSIKHTAEDLYEFWQCSK